MNESLRVAMYRRHLMRRKLATRTVELRVYWLRRLETACGHLDKLSRERLDVFLSGAFSAATKRTIEATARDYWRFTP